MTNRAPLIAAIVMLLLPVSYVGSYFALAIPTVHYSCRGPDIVHAEYRTGGVVAAAFFWPLEQIDRKVRPEAWEEHLTAISNLPIESLFPLSFLMVMQ